MLCYKDLKHKPTTLVAMTSLNPTEFAELLQVFSATWESETGLAGKDPSKGGRPPAITAMADRLLFILFYLKTYPLQEVIAHLFGISQPQANAMIHQLSAVLNKTLEAMGHKPIRLAEEMLERLNKEPPQRLGMDGTERRVNRPVNEVGQKLHYSGKKNATP